MQTIIYPAFGPELYVLTAPDNALNLGIVALKQWRACPLEHARHFFHRFLVLVN